MSKEYDLGRVVGKDATINGQNAIQLIPGKNIDITQDGENVTIGLNGELDNPHFDDKNNPHKVTAEQVGAVPNSRSINGRTLDEDITLSSDDVGAAPINHGAHVQYDTNAPNMDGTANVGSSSKVARADHVHPHDTSKQDKLTGKKGQVVGFDEEGNAVAKILSVEELNYFLYGFQINPDESDPSKMIKYIAQNSSYDSAFMDYEKDEFNYGDWADAWFIKGIKPVILNFDGTVAYELDHNDYSKTIDGTSIDITSDSVDGNVMVGIPIVWVKYVEVNSKPTFYFSDIKLDDQFHAYAHTDANGNIMPYTYMSAYNGYRQSYKLRSLSNKTPSQYAMDAGISESKKNNPEGKNMWDIDVLADRQLINLLLLLIGKSTDTQTVFGNGNMNGYRNPAPDASSYGILPTGSMDTKGLFWGSNKDNLGVKVFGIENFWGSMERHIQGMVLQDNVITIKMTSGTDDGSTATDYNETGEGYIDTGVNIKSTGYIKIMEYTRYGLLPKTIGGSSTTYFPDGIVAPSDGIRLCRVGGHCTNVFIYGSNCGAFAGYLASSGSQSGYTTVCLSCKPY